jgi:hypothetical protein
MSNYLSIDEAIELSGIPSAIFNEKYLQGGVISVKVEDGKKTIEVSEFLRVFPHAKIEKNKSHADIAIDNQLKQMKIENLEYQVANLQRQLEKHSEEYEWLRSKFDNTTLLLEQKLDTSEIDKYKQEIRQLTHQAMQWEKKYNTLLAANELKSLLKENMELKQKLESSAPKAQPTKVANPVTSPQASIIEAPIHQRTQIPEQSIPPQMQPINQGATNVLQQPQQKAKRRKIFGVF